MSSSSKVGGLNPPSPPGSAVPVDLSIIHMYIFSYKYEYVLTTWKKFGRKAGRDC